MILGQSKPEQRLRLFETKINGWIHLGNVMSTGINNPKSLSWTQEQRSFMIGWISIFGSNERLSQERALWPEENTEALKAVEIPRKMYYEDLNQQYFNQPEIILEIGADLRSGWTDSIDPSRHVVVRSSWSQREEHPDIWQIPLEELIDILDSPQWSWLAKRLTSIVMENTLSCLEQHVVLKLLGFTRKYAIRIVALKYRPLSAPCLEQLRASGRSKLMPEKECPSIVLATEQILHLLFTTPQPEEVNRVLYLYRPPIGEPIIVPKWLPKNELGFEHYQQLKTEEHKSSGAVVVLPIPQNVLDSQVEHSRIIKQLLFVLLSLRSKSNASYRVHMMNDLCKQLTLADAWGLSVKRLAEIENRKLSMFHDSVGAVSTQEVLHTADGELIRPKAFIQDRRSSQFLDEVLSRYAYGLVGVPEQFGLSVERVKSGDQDGVVFQAFRFEIL